MGCILVIDKEIVQQARQTDLAAYLISVGVPLVRKGKRHRHKEHESLVFTKNAYYWNARQEHGNSVDYLQRHMNMDFMDAVEALVGFIPVATVDEEAVELNNLEIALDYKRVIAYLNKTRYIDYKVIKHLITTKHLYQEQKTNNIIFPMYDEFNNYVGAELQGTLSDKRFKGIKAGSKYGYGFNIRYSKNKVYNYALFFESAIDLISFIDLKQNHEKKSLDRCLLISMGGLKTNILEHTLKVFQYPNLSVFLCVDNDNAGQAFKDAVKGLKIDFKTYLPKEGYKDWNDQLKDLKNQNNQSEKGK